MGKRKLVFGVGINDADYPVGVGGRGSKIALLARADQLDDDRLLGLETIKL